MVEKKVWLITGCSSGFGQEIAAEALRHGDIVVATARDPSKLDDLAAKGAILERLDVTASDVSLAKTVANIVQGCRAMGSKMCRVQKKVLKMS